MLDAAITRAQLGLRVAYVVPKKLPASAASVELFM
jgi:hypothetical protein